MNKSVVRGELSHFLTNHILIFINPLQICHVDTMVHLFCFFGQLYRFAHCNFHMKLTHISAVVVIILNYFPFLISLVSLVSCRS